LTRGANENTIDSNDIVLQGTDARGIELEIQANNNLVTSNTIVLENLVGSGGALGVGSVGISMEHGSGVGSNGNIFRDNHISGAAQSIVILVSKDNIIEDNLIWNSGAARLWGGNNNIFRYNVIEEGANGGDRKCFVGDNCQVVSLIDCNLDMGIHVSGETGSTITENVIRNMVGEGIVVSDLVREKRDFTPGTLQTCYASKTNSSTTLRPPNV